MIKRLLKSILKKTVFRPNRIYPIYKGPMRGLKFKVTANTEWSPIFGNWEPESQYLFKHLIREGQTVFDLGANTGIHTLLFSKLVGDSGWVIAFEPVPDNITEITYNLSINHFTNCKIQTVAVSDKAGETVFKLGVNHKRGSLTGIGHESGNLINVKVVSLDGFCAADNIYPDFVKIDIEGGEKDALQGFESAVEKSHPIIYVESHDLENELAIKKFMARHDYTVYRLKKNSVSDLNIRHIELVKDGEPLFTDNRIGSGTVIGIHESKISSINLRRIPA